MAIQKFLLTLMYIGYHFLMKKYCWGWKFRTIKTSSVYRNFIEWYCAVWFASSRFHSRISISKYLRRMPWIFVVSIEIQELRNAQNIYCDFSSLKSILRAFSIPVRVTPSYSSGVLKSNKGSISSIVLKDKRQFSFLISVTRFYTRRWRCFEYLEWCWIWICYRLCFLVAFI